MSKNRDIKRRRKLQRRRSARRAAPTLQRVQHSNGPVWSAQTSYQSIHSVIVQGTDLAAVKSAVTAVEGDVTHELNIIGGVGAEVTAA